MSLWKPVFMHASPADAPAHVRYSVRAGTPAAREGRGSADEICDLDNVGEATHT